MTKPPRNPWPFQDLAFRLAPVLVAFMGWHLVWNAAVPLDPAWTPPPRDKTVRTIGVISSRTDAPQPNGFDYETVDGRRLKLLCEPRNEAPATPCLNGRGRMGDHAGRYVAIRYYETTGPAPQRILLGAKSGQDWLLRPEDQKAHLAARAEGDRTRKVHWRTAISAAATLAAGFIVLLLVRRRQRGAR
ncbi:hypothetical protein [Caulobacter hibisci]|uniref:DUF3592 domain-containing protein n=1 Tax=Caulobacter hibisci TaxID=2035993 RepID=A0ABS0T6B9_9CAUL|nr:hypothetical protein [Caulobacter hibisci]MBI1686640.1 hypothetical protein [Caulobacter hibisci]